MQAKVIKYIQMPVSDLEVKGVSPQPSSFAAVDGSSMRDTSLMPLMPLMPDVKKHDQVDMPELAQIIDDDNVRGDGGDLSLRIPLDYLSTGGVSTSLSFPSGLDFNLFLKDYAEKKRFTLPSAEAEAEGEAEEMVYLKKFKSKQITSEEKFILDLLNTENISTITLSEEDKVALFQQLNALNEDSHTSMTEDEKKKLMQFVVLHVIAETTLGHEAQVQTELLPLFKQTQILYTLIKNISDNLSETEKKEKLKKTIFKIITDTDTDAFNLAKITKQKLELVSKKLTILNTRNKIYGEEKDMEKLLIKRKSSLQSSEQPTSVIAIQHKSSFDYKPSSLLDSITVNINLQNMPPEALAIINSASFAEGKKISQQNAKRLLEIIPNSVKCETVSVPKDTEEHKEETTIQSLTIEKVYSEISVNTKSINDLDKKCNELTAIVAMSLVDAIDNSPGSQVELSRLEEDFNHPSEVLNFLEKYVKPAFEAVNHGDSMLDIQINVNYVYLNLASGYQSEFKGSLDEVIGKLKSFMLNQNVAMKSLLGYDDGDTSFNKVPTVTSSSWLHRGKHIKEVREQLNESAKRKGAKKTLTALDSTSSNSSNAHSLLRKSNSNR